jgi:hypothetical protein
MALATDSSPHRVHFRRKTHVAMTHDFIPMAPCLRGLARLVALCMAKGMGVGAVSIGVDKLDSWRYQKNLRRVSGQGSGMQTQFDRKTG